MGSIHIVKASAGSGKTFQLTYEYIARVIETPGLYRNILAVTFTNKATEEMKQRIVSKLNELNTDGVEAMSHTFPYNNVFREDVVVNGDDRENMLKNAPEQKDGCYKVPKTFD